MSGSSRVVLLPDRRNAAGRSALVDRVRGQFREMPGLRLTPAQAQRLFGLRAEVCARVLAALVAEGTLRCDADGRFGLGAKGTMRRRTRDRQEIVA